MYKLINGYMIIECSNCNKNFNKKELECKKRQGYYFCDKSCKASYKLTNPHLKIDKYNSENSIMNMVSKIKDNNQLNGKMAHSI